MTAGLALLYRKARHLYDAEMERERAVEEQPSQHEYEVDWASEGF